MQRRDFVGNLLVGAMGLAACGCATRSATSTHEATPLEVSELTDRLFLIQGAGANVVVAVGPEGLLLVDGGLAAHSSGLLGVLSRRWPGRPVQKLINTHWHLNHTGSNDVLGRRGTAIIAHENTRLWMKTEFFSQWEERRYPPRAPAAIPTETVYTSGSIEFGGEEVRYVHAPRAHTDGDLYIHFPASNVLVTGGLVSVGRYPGLDYTTGGFIRGMRDASSALLALTDASTRIVPGIGDTQGRDHMQAQATMLETLSERFVDLLKKGLSAEEMLGMSATAEFDAQWGDPRLFVHNAYRGMWGHVHSLGVF